MKTILIVEDDEAVCESIRAFLEDEHKVLTAYSGEKGLEVLAGEDVSLIVLDYELPDINGIEVLKKIKSKYRVPVIIITGHGNRDIILDMWRCKADYYFDKPFKIIELGEKIRELLTPQNAAVPFDALALDPSALSPHILKALASVAASLSKQEPGRISLKKISAVASVSPKYLTALFKKECGRSFYEIITGLKIEKAKKLLSEGREIKEIAAALGFKYQNNFCKFFKKLTGKSPSEVKNKPV